MNFNTIIVMDYETGGLDAKRTQPTQLAAVAIDPRKLEIIEDSVFQSYVQPEFDEEKLTQFGLDPIGDKALEITGISLETLHAAPTLKVVWQQFTEYVNQFNKTGRLWDSPICAGFNNFKYDDIITERIIGGNKRFNPEAEKEPYKFGPWDESKKQGKLFHPRDRTDALLLMWGWFENDNTVKSLSLDNLRDKFGISKENAHNAIADVCVTASLLIKFLKLQRHVHAQMKHKFANSFVEENKTIARILNNYKK